MKISAVILTKNEESNIKRCLESLDFCDEIIIIDDYSTDKTTGKIRNSKLEIRNKFRIQIFQKKLNNNFSEQRNFGLSKTSNEWVLFIDADEEVTKELANEIKSYVLGGEWKESQAFYIKRRDFFWEKELKYGEVKKVREQGIIRLVKKNSGQWKGTVHEVFHTDKKTGQLKGFLNHYPHQTLKEFINDINCYSSIRAEELFNRGDRSNVFQIIFFPFGKFFYNYFFNLGFLDGPAGFAYAFMMSFHSFLVRAKLYQMTNKK
jgi:glycosyltransferase involved in cell wall biosynthesis